MGRQSDVGRRLLVAANYGPTRGQCYVRLAGKKLGAGTVLLHDLMHPTTTYERNGGDLGEHGLYLDLPAWGYHVFEVTTRA
jgi:hypothetical protein